MDEPRILAVAHVYYPELWPELARCIGNLGDQADLIVTYSDESAVSAARRDFPRARFLRCENRGYDIWPFLHALQSISPSDYDYIVKLHTKREVREGIILNHALIGGTNWRRLLLRFVSTRRDWRKALSKLAKPKIGMVADRRVIFDRKAATALHYQVFDLAKDEMQTLAGKTFARGDFVAGTMFAVKPAALAPLLRKHHAAQDFAESAGHGGITHAHIMERMLGLSVSAAGMRIESFDGPSVRLRRWWYKHVRRVACNMR